LRRSEVRYVLDTTFVIDHLRSDSAAVHRFASLFENGDEVFVNEVVVCEAWSGAHLPDDPDLEALLQVIEFVQPAPVHARAAGRWRAEARARGWNLGLPDALIAACADSLDAAVLTRNARDFALTPVRVETY
jgi:predicted nucleic acid-binding protein